MKVWNRNFSQLPSLDRFDLKFVLITFCYSPLAAGRFIALKLTGSIYRRINPSNGYAGGGPRALRRQAAAVRPPAEVPSARASADAGSRTADGTCATFCNCAGVRIARTCSATLSWFCSNCCWAFANLLVSADEIARGYRAAGKELGRDRLAGGLRICSNWLRMSAAVGSCRICFDLAPAAPASGLRRARKSAVPTSRPSCRRRGPSWRTARPAAMAHLSTHQPRHQRQHQQHCHRDRQSKLSVSSNNLLISFGFA